MDVSVIIVSFNTREILKACLESVFKHTRGVQFEVIVVDNNSTDGSIEYIKDQIESITSWAKIKDTKQKLRIIENKENMGFGRANNQGMKVAKGRYVLLLNSDTLLLSDSISEMVGWMDKNKSCGVVGCTLLGKEKAVQASGGYFPTLGRVFLWATFLDDIPLLGSIFGSYHPHANFLSGGFYNREKELDWVTGAFFLLRHEIISQVGGFDENFFMYVEELEYCYRIKKASWKVFYAPITRIMHLGGASGVRENIIRGEFNGLRLFYSTHKSLPERLLLEIFLKVAALIRIIVHGLLGRKEEVLAYAKALV